MEKTLVMDTEIWKDIPGFDGYYQASDQGRIRSLSHLDSINRFWPSTVLKGTIKENKYVNVGLWVNGKMSTRYVHRLIVLAFSGQSPKSIDHINGIKTDNRLVNLEVVTYRENIHRYREGERNLPIGVYQIKGRTGRKYQAYINREGIQLRLGNFRTVDEAHSAYKNELNRINGNA